MNIRGFLDRLIGRAAEVRSYTAWDAAGAGNRLANWDARPAAVNAWLDIPVIVRARSEGEFKNNPWARKIVDATLAAVIGAAGLNPQFKDRAITEAWGAWADSCDAAGRLDWVQFLWLTLQTVMVSGECFIRFGLNPDAALPLTLQVLGPEFLDTSHVDAHTFAGIRYDGVRRDGYWLYERHPTLAPMRSVFDPASECLHEFRPIAPGASASPLAGGGPAGVAGACRISRGRDRPREDGKFVLRVCPDGGRQQPPEREQHSSHARTWLHG